jgi:hypothetical protein
MTARTMAIAAAAALVLAAAGGLYWAGLHAGAARERPKLAAALAEAQTARLEAEAAKASAQRVEVAVHRREAAGEAVTRLTTKALTSEDAHAPLDPDRAARLRDADRELCVTAPDLCPADRDPR